METIVYDNLIEEPHGNENVGFLLMDQNNHLRVIRMRDFRKGDAYVLIRILNVKESENPIYFFMQYRLMIRRNSQTYFGQIRDQLLTTNILMMSPSIPLSISTSMK